MAFNKRGSQQKSRRIFKNEDIKAFTILVVDEHGEKLGTMPRKKALELAAEKSMDLVQVSYDPKTKICTAKVIDFGKHQYESKKLESEKRKKMKAKVQKEVKFGYNIGDHDLEMKVKKAKQFLDKGHPVKINVVLKGREKMYRDIVRVKLDGVEEQLKDHGKTQGVKKENYGFTLVIAAYKQKAVGEQKSKKERRQLNREKGAAAKKKEQEQQAKKSSASAKDAAGSGTDTKRKAPKFVPKKSVK